jgi:hypothetical protein
MDQLAVDTALKRIRAAYALNYAFANQLARILHLFHARGELNRRARAVFRLMELQLQRSRLMPNAPPNLALAPNHSIHGRTHRQNNLVLAHKVSRQDRMNRVTHLRRISSDRCSKTNPKRLASRKLIAPKCHHPGSTHHPPAYEPTLDDGGNPHGELDN